MRLLALLLLLSVPAFANDEVRVERRMLVKEGRVYVHAGGSWLARGDYYDSPTAIAGVQYYPLESGGIDLRAGWIGSSISASAQEVLERAGAIPDAQQPRALLLAGWKQGVGYGKVAVGGAIVHFDLQLGVAAGTLLTNRAWTPALATSAGALVRLGARLHGVLEIAVLGSYEERRAQRLVFGALPTLAVGASW